MCISGSVIRSVSQSVVQLVNFVGPQNNVEAIYQAAIYGLH